MDTNETSERFHEEFTAIATAILEAARDAHIEATTEVTTNTVIAQILMNWLESDEPVNKRDMLEAAEYMGPDWAQGLYHAAVFMTKVA